VRPVEGHLDHVVVTADAQVVGHDGEGTASR